MLNTLLGSKQSMSHTYVEETRVPVTWVKAGPCIVTQIKKEEKDGYWAVQLGFGERNVKNTSKPLQGHLRKVTPNIKESKTPSKLPRFLKEVRLDKEPEYKVGDEIKVSDIFKKGDVIAVTGTSKGKGFAGVVKRWKFGGGPRTHGQSDRERAPGSIGQGTTPGRVLKGKKMAGRMGQDTVTVKNLIVVDVKASDSLLAIYGSVPGIPGGLIKIKKIKEGSLEELIEETPQVKVQQVEYEETTGAAETENAKKQDAAEETKDKVETGNKE